MEFFTFQHEEPGGRWRISEVVKLDSLDFLKLLLNN